jgi:ketosteroid isomerase-like protein
MDSSGVHKFTGGLRPAFEAGDDAVATKQAEAACVALVESQFAAIASGDYDAFRATLADDVEMENVGPSTLPFSGSWKGPVEVTAAVKRHFAMIEDQRPEVQTVVAQGDTVVVTGRELGKYRPTGRVYDIHFVQFFTIRGGKLVRFRQVIDSAAMLDAVTDRTA